MTNNLEQYKVFYYAAKLGSVTKAAQALSISQPAVSQSLKQLEQSAGTKLFVRTAKGMTLSAEGALLYRYVEKGYEEIELGEKMLTRMCNLEIGELRIGASDMTLQFYLLPYLERFHEKYPGVKVIVSNAPTPDTLEYLKADRIEFGVVTTPFEVPKGIEAKKVRCIEDVFVAGSLFEEWKGKTLSWKELEKLPLITLEKETSTRRFLDEFLAGKGVVLQPEFELATSGIIVQFALRNLGIGHVMRDFAEKELASGQLFALHFQEQMKNRHMCVVTKSGSKMTKAAERMLTMIEEER